MRRCELRYSADASRRCTPTSPRAQARCSTFPRAAWPACSSAILSTSSIASRPRRPNHSRVSGDPFAADVISQGDTVLDSGAPSKLTPGHPRRTLPSHEDFRYSMMAARSSAENAGPMTPLPRCVLEPVARVAVARLRGVEQSRPCQFVANARVPGGRGRRTMSRDLPARCSADGRSDPRCRQAPTRRLCPGHPCSRCGA
jgi:hypothetical protein